MLTLRRRGGTKHAESGAAGRGHARDRVRIVKMASFRETPDRWRSAMITLAHFLVLARSLFCIAVAGIFINRKNVIVLLMASS